MRGCFEVVFLFFQTANFNNVRISESGGSSLVPFFFSSGKTKNALSPILRFSSHSSGYRKFIIYYVCCCLLGFNFQGNNNGSSSFSYLIRACGVSFPFRSPNQKTPSLNRTHFRHFCSANGDDVDVSSFSFHDVCNFFAKRHKTFSSSKLFITHLPEFLNSLLNFYTNIYIYIISINCLAMKWGPSVHIVSFYHHNYDLTIELNC